MPEAEALALFRAGLRQLAASVAIVTSGEAEDAAGATITSVASLSFEPPSLIVCLNRGSRAHARVRAAGAFRVTWLREGQRALAEAFARSGADHAAHFRDGPWRAAPFGPKLETPLADACCRLDGAFDYGTHTLFVGAVAAAACHPGAPLLYRDGAYRRAAEAAL